MATIAFTGVTFAEVPFLKGVTVSCQTWGTEWQTPEMAQTLDELQSLGVNSFAIHPYARITNDGAVMFRPLAGDKTEVRLVVDADPDGLIEEVGDRLGVLDRRVGGDLERFRTFIEGRSAPSGRWSGEIHGDQVSPGTHVDASRPSTTALHHPDVDASELR